MPLLKEYNKQKTFEYECCKMYIAYFCLLFIKKTTNAEILIGYRSILL